MVSNEITTAATLSTKASKARAAQVAEAATDAATTNRAAAEAWDALATQAATHAAQCRHGADLAERTRHRWAH